MRVLFAHLSVKKFFLIAGVTFNLYFSTYTFANSQIHYEKALSAFNQEKFDESMIHLKNALQAAPENLPSKILMGKLLAQLGHFVTAKVEFDEVIRQGADISSFANHWAATLLKNKEYEQIINYTQFNNFSTQQKIDWQRLRASACLQTQNYQCAKQSFTTIGSLSGNQAEQLNGLAQIELILKNYTKAELLLAQALELTPDNSTTWQLKGLTARSQNKLEAALSYLQKAFELAPDEPLILRHLADVYLASNKNEDAKKTVQNILIASPDDPFAILVNSWLHQNTELETDAEAKFKEMAAKINNLSDEYVNQEQSLLFLRALVAFREQNFVNAVRDFTNLRKLDDDDLSPSILLAKSYIALGKERDAVEILESKEQELQTLPNVMAMLGDLYINSGKNFKALSLLQNLKSQYPNDLQIQLLEAKLMIARGKTAEGLKAIEQLTVDFPNNQTVLFVHCVLSLQTEQYNKANDSITKLLELQPKDPLKLNIKGAVLLKLNQIDQAQIYIRQALTYEPNLISAKINLASTYFLQNKYSQSQATLDSILNQNPRYAPALLLLAKIQTTQNKLNLALANFKKVLVEDRQSIEALEGVTTIYLAQGELQNALTQLNKLTKIQRDHPKYVIQKAQIYISLKDQENSNNQIRNLARIAKGNAALLIALSKLQLMANDLPAAINSLSTAQKIQPNSLPLAIQFTELLLNNKQTDAAVRHIEHISQKFPDFADVTFLQGRLAEQLGDLNKANQLYAKTLEINDEYELALGKMYALTTNGVADTLFKNKVDKIVETYPNRYFPRNLLAQYYYYRGNLSQAALHYEILLKHKDLPNQAAMLVRLANTYITNNIEKSIAYAKQAFELDATNVQVLTTYGWLLTQQKQANEGLQLLRKAVALGQQNPAIHYYIAQSLSQLGLNKEAKAELDTLFANKVMIAEQEQAKVLYNSL
ncbi:PEP-CTERM system TPR-repeat protein PrsT [Paraglaciecola aquimarina]|uniref:PEP-CTERM system TPR-repeat protein PrsT n=1 Tax=Paraglaciecola algarum TaxID=3050085 RepID=A0ABS9DD67_9ALTE|nr:XrtA/PEP-CTERM system TPR-repeat protein PrsT [Paraglaciecola sp. G1-23]MCF2949942.1 PEP-CTERM system TPR-repeat protein PrsT [Paraglaciecola sp. G1-23]